MLEEGYSMQCLEETLLAFGMPMSPFVLSDEVGNDVAYKVSKTFEAAYGERMKSPKILAWLAEHQLYGRKTGKGFYLYRDGQRKGNPAINAFLKSLGNSPAYLPVEAIIPRFIYSMVNEAARCLQERIIARADYLDLSLIMGMGFPPFHGGLLRYADKIGLEHIVKVLKDLEISLGPRFQVCALLAQKAQAGETFYPK